MDKYTKFLAIIGGINLFLAGITLGYILSVLIHQLIKS